MLPNSHLRRAYSALDAAVIYCIMFIKRKCCICVSSDDVDIWKPFCHACSTYLLQIIHHDVHTAHYYRTHTAHYNPNNMHHTSIYYIAIISK